jgi:hypothetical protein
MKLDPGPTRYMFFSLFIIFLITVPGRVLGNWYVRKNFPGPTEIYFVVGLVPLEKVLDFVRTKFLFHGKENSLEESIFSPLLVTCSPACATHLGRKWKPTRWHLIPPLCQY